MMRAGVRFLIGFLACFLGSASLLWADSGLGVFTRQGDVGKPAHAGSATYDQATGTYRVTGGGANMWARTDAFHFVWKKMTGNVELAATIHWLGTGKEAHRKACLLIRQNLDADSPYVDAALHGDGLTSLQYRQTPGGLTYEIQADVRRPARMGIVKQGDWFFMTAAREGQPLQPAGGSIRLHLREPFYVGLGVCSHNDGVLETADFRDVHLDTVTLPPSDRRHVDSALEVVDIRSQNRQVIYHTTHLIEAPNWMHDGKHLLFNSGGNLYRLPSAGGKPEQIDTGAANRCNNDHGLSPDNRLLAVSSQQAPDHQSRIYLVPATGGAAKQLTPKGSSYWHGWSPDGKTIVYCAQRDGEFDVYSMPVTGGPEKRLTTAPGLDDGPDFSPDGKWIYFNSVRGGTMQIYRMKPDGSAQQAVTADNYNNWFPHPSPDGKWLVFLSYDKSVTGHPGNKEVLLRIMPLSGGKPRVLATVFGGQGTINVPSWSPDSRRLAFVSYLPVS